MIDKKILDIYFSRGLTAGIGSADGQVCIEAVIALATGQMLTDRPSCVSHVDRAFWIGINDAPWSSPEARAAALRPAVLPQIGTAGTDRGPWVRALVLGMIREVLPLALQAAASAAPNHAALLLAAAELCAAAPDLASAAEAAKASKAASSSKAMAMTARATMAAALDASCAASKASMRAAETMWEMAALNASDAASEASDAASEAARTTMSVEVDGVLKASVAVALRAYAEIE